MFVLDEEMRVGQGEGKEEKERKKRKQDQDQRQAAEVVLCTRVENE